MAKHWTQSPAGRKKLSKQSLKMWVNRRKKGNTSRRSNSTDELALDALREYLAAGTRKVPPAIGRLVVASGLEAIRHLRR